MVKIPLMKMKSRKKRKTSKKAQTKRLKKFQRSIPWSSSMLLVSKVAFPKVQILLKLFMLSGDSTGLSYSMIIPWSG